MFLEIEKIAERFGVPHDQIPAFITSIAEVLSTYLRQERVENWRDNLVENSQWTAR
jgi:hypothetical protein